MKVISKSTIRNRGYILLPVLIVITVIAAVALMTSQESNMNIALQKKDSEIKQVDYVTEAGLEHTLYNIQQAGCGPYADIPSTNFNSNNYTSSISTNAVGATINYYTIPVTDDAYIKDEDGNGNYGNDAQLHTFFSLIPYQINRTLYRFDIENAGIPAGSQILSATAKLFVIDPNDFSAVSVHQITKDWNEASVTWNTINSDHDTNAITSIPAGPAVGKAVELNITSLVQGWVNGSTDNYGIMLKTTFVGDRAQFASKEYGDNNQHPELIVKVLTGPISDRASVSVTGTLASGVNRTIDRDDIVLHQQPFNTIVLQPDSTGKDSFIEGVPGHHDHNKATDKLIKTNSETGKEYRGLIEFDLSSIPYGAKIQSAELQLNLSDSIGIADVVKIYPITNAWIENEVTWLARDSSHNWNSAGGDYDSSDLALFTADTPGFVTADIQSIAQSWVDGTTNNYGIILLSEPQTGINEKKFTSSDDNADPTLNPKLTITYTCECGIVCIAPQGSGTILLVVDDAINLTSSEINTQDSLERLGYTVNLIADDENKAAIDSAMLVNDVAYISKSTTDSNIGNKFDSISKGVITENRTTTDELGISTQSGLGIGRSVEVVDTSHEISSVFPSSYIPIYTKHMQAVFADGTVAPGLQTLFETASKPGLAVIDQGDTLSDGNTAAGRRVLLPFGEASQFNPKYLNNNGQLLLQRSIEWAKNSTEVDTPIANLLFVTNAPDEANLTDEDIARKQVLESWRYTVNLIQDTASQTEFDAAVANNEVVYVSESVNSTNINTKLNTATIGVVNEEGPLLYDFEMASAFSSSSQDKLDIVDNSHYISQPFSIGEIKIYNIKQNSNYLTGSISPGVQTLGESSNSPSLVIVEQGDELRTTAAAGRRVELPWGESGSFDFSKLTDDAKTILQRALEWGVEIPQPPGPVAHWTFDDNFGTTAVDSANGFDGDLTNGPVWRTDGKLDGALSFDGIDDRVIVKHDPALAISSKLTITAWVNNQDSSLSRSYRIISKETNGQNDAYWMAFSGTSLFVAIGGNFFSPSYSFTTNKWYHLAMTFDDAADELNIYVDGALVLTQATTAVLNTNTAEIQIGNNWQDSKPWLGMLDDVRIYDDILNQTEINTVAGLNKSAPPVASVCNGNFLDQFNDQTFAGDDGTLSWSGDWQEVGESDGPDSGDIRVTNDSGNYQLRTKDNDSGGEGVEREVDLTGATRARLSYEYRRDNLDDTNDYTVVEMSANGSSGPWKELTRHQGPTNDGSYQSINFDISDYISSNTRIRFKTSASMGGSDRVWFDNIEIECSP